MSVGRDHPDPFIFRLWNRRDSHRRRGLYAVFEV